MSRKKQRGTPLPSKAKKDLYVLAVVTILAIGIPLLAIIWANS